ncbi:MAG: hypothetical protein ACXVYV_00910 [Gaiellales bacterium]
MACAKPSDEPVARFERSLPDACGVFRFASALPARQPKPGKAKRA